MVGIYKITSPTGRVYIGQSLNLESRTYQYSNLNTSLGQPRLNRSFNKHGFDNHIIEIIEECNVNALNERERYYQDKYNATGLMGLNCILTKTESKKMVHSEESKRKMSIARKGKRMGIESSFYGRKHTQESIRKANESKAKKQAEISKKLSEYSKNRTVEHRANISMANTGHVHSEEQKQKIGDAVRGEKNGFYGKKHTELTRKRMSENSRRLSKGDNPKAKKVKNTDTGMIHLSIIEAADYYDYNVHGLRKKLRGDRPNNTNLISID